MNTNNIKIMILEGNDPPKENNLFLSKMFNTVISTTTYNTVTYVLSY